MKKYFLFIVLVILSCYTLAADESNDQNSGSIGNVTYRPIQPINFSDFYAQFDYFSGERSDYVSQALEKVDSDSTEILRLFPNESSRVYIEAFDVDGKISYGVTSISKAKTLYHVTIDYLKYRTDSKGETVYVSGVGLRMRAKIKSDKKGVDLSSLFAIGLAASEKKLSGSLEFDSIGISGPEITPLVPIPSNLSMESISTSIQALAAIKAKLYANQDGVDIWPQITGIVGGDPATSLKELIGAPNGNASDTTNKPAAATHSPPRDGTCFCKRIMTSAQDIRYKNATK